MMAPKPLHLISSTQNWTKATQTSEYPAVRGVYDLFDAGSKVTYAHIDAKHNYNRQSREAAYRFFCRSVPAVRQVAPWSTIMWLASPKSR